MECDEYTVQCTQCSVYYTVWSVHHRVCIVQLQLETHSVSSKAEKLKRIPKLCQYSLWSNQDLASAVWQQRFFWWIISFVTVIRVSIKRHLNLLFRVLQSSSTNKALQNLNFNFNLLYRYNMTFYQKSLFYEKR